MDRQGECQGINAIALVLMEESNITRYDYGIRHHGGYLGHKARLDNEAFQQEKDTTIA